MRGAAGVDREYRSDGTKNQKRGRRRTQKVWTAKEGQRAEEHAHHEQRNGKVHDLRVVRSHGSSLSSDLARADRRSVRSAPVGG